MVNTSTHPYFIKWHFPLLWIAINTIVNPIAIFAGFVATYIAAPWNTGPIDSQSLSDPVSTLVIRSLAFAITVGVIFEVPRWLMLRRFIGASLWIPITIPSLAIAMFSIYQNQESSVIANWAWPNCLIDLPSHLVSLLPLVLVGVLQSLILLRKKHRWYFWLVVGSTSYILPIAGFAVCLRNGLLAGSFIAALVTLVALPFTAKESYG